MSDQLIKLLASRWARLGVMLNVDAAGRTPDVERLLLDTARFGPANSRLFILATTWLAKYGIYVAKHRLARLIFEELEPQHQPALGLMLELAILHGDRFIGSRFKLAIDACAPAAISGPLFDVERRNKIFEKLAEQRATELSRKWGVWAADFEMKTNALRPIQWIVVKNPSLAARALASGVQASILAECEADGNAIESESELARKCGVTRAAVREALRGLELAGLVLSESHGRSHSIELAGAAISRT